jgi:hypothetical protein
MHSDFLHGHILTIPFLDTCRLSLLNNLEEFLRLAGRGIPEKDLEYYQMLVKWQEKDLEEHPEAHAQELRLKMKKEREEKEREKEEMEMERKEEQAEGETDTAGSNSDHLDL